MSAPLESLGRLLRRMLVREVNVECLLDEELFAILLPHVEKFR